MAEQSTILKSVTGRRATIGFWFGAALGFVAAIVANLVPYILTRGAYRTDGVEIVGFPFLFRSFGGFSPAYQFSHLALSADIVIALAVSVSAGFLTMCSIGLFGRQRRFAWCAGPQRSRAPWQFTLRQLLLTVALAAVVCAADMYIAAALDHSPISPH